MRHIEEAKLHAYADGELIKSETETIERHLIGCLSCNRKQKEIANIKELITDNSLMHPSEHFTQNVLSMISIIPFNPTLKNKNNFLFKLPYVFAATLALLVFISTLFLPYNFESESVWQESTQFVLTGNTKIVLYSSQVLEHGNNFLKLFFGNIFNATDDTSAYLMLLFFVGSILIYQLIEFFNARVRHRNNLLNLFV